MLTWIWTELMRSTKNYHAVAMVLLLTVIALTLSACGITAPRSNDGYANLDSPGISDTNRTMSLSLGPTTLRFAARFLDDEPETKALLKSLDGVRIRIYEVHGDTDRISQRFDRMGNKLSNDGWQPVMLVREEGELVQMYSKSSSRFYTSRSYKRLKGTTNQSQKRATTSSGRCSFTRSNHHLCA